MRLRFQEYHEIKQILLSHFVYTIAKLGHWTSYFDVMYTLLCSRQGMTDQLLSTKGLNRLGDQRRNRTLPQSFCNPDKIILFFRFLTTEMSPISSSVS